MRRIKHSGNDVVIKILNTMKKNREINNTGYENILLSYFEILENRINYNIERATREIVDLILIYKNVDRRKREPETLEKEYRKKIRSWLEKIIG